MLCGFQNLYPDFFRILLRLPSVLGHTVDMTTNTTAAKTTVTVVLPDGTTESMTTKKNPTHAVALFTSAESIITEAREEIATVEGYRGSWTDEEIAKSVARNEAKIAAAADGWSVLSWCGRHDLAVKASAAAAKWAGASNLKIVEVAN